MISIYLWNSVNLSHFKLFDRENSSRKISKTSGCKDIRIMSMGKAIIFFIPDIEIFWSFGFLVWLGGETGLGLGGWTVELYASGETGLGLGGWTVELYASGETGLGLGCWLLCDCTENVLQLCMVDGRGAGKLCTLSSLYLVDIDITGVLPDVLADRELSALASESSVSDFINGEGGGNGLE